MNEVGPADRSRPRGSIEDRITSITTTRKRKFSQFFAVAAPTDALPNHEIANTNAPHSQPGEVGVPQYQDVFKGTNSGPPKLNHDGLAKLLLSIGLWGRGATTLPDHGADTKIVSATPTPSPIPRFEGSAPGPKRIEQKRPEVAQKPLGQDPASLQLAAEQLKEDRKGKAPTVPPQQAEPTPSRVPTPVQTPTPRENRAPRKDVKEGSESAEVSISRAASPHLPPPKRQKIAPVETPAAGDGQVQGGVSMGMRQASQAGSATELLPKAPGPRNDESAGSSTKPQNGAIRPPDVVSSPGSTAPSATTPAIHDISTNTSPDNDGMQYAEPSGEDKPEQDESGDVVMVEASTSDAAKTSSHGQAAPIAEMLRRQAQSVSPTPPRPESQTGPPPGPKAPALPSATPEIGQPLAQPPAISASVTPDEKKLPAPPKSPPQEEPANTAGPSGPRVEVADSKEASPAALMDVDKPSSSAEAGIDKEIAEKKPSAGSSHTKTPQGSAPEAQAPVPERAVTRVSSGAIRQKSVSEILGETPRTSAAADRAATLKGPTPPMAPQPTAHARGGITKRKPKDRKQVSTVVFGKQARRQDEKTVAASKEQEQSPPDDYFTPLFIEAFTARSGWMKPLGALLTQAHKTVSSSDTQLALDDDRACKVLKRVYMAQHSNKWSLRQRQRQPEPTRPPSHLDVLLGEMKWMRTDFRYERKWKTAQAKILADACAAWKAASPEERLALQVPAVPPPRQSDRPTVKSDVSGMDEPLPTPGIMPDDPEAPADEESETVSPSAIFGLPEDQIVFHLHRSAAADMLLDNLPMYSSPLKVPRSDLIEPEYDPDASWRRPALPLSKYVEGDLKLVTDGQPTWKSGFHYEIESEDEEAEKPDAATRKRNYLPPENKDVALFNPEYRAVRDRLHATHHFRPPADHPMPPQGFYEHRVASQWTQEEDTQLRSLIGQYSYNWPLISDVLSTRSTFVSGAERRTSWECFERWLQLEPLAPDLAKTQYFRAYNQRIENAQRVVAQQHQTAVQNATANNTPPPKRKQCVPFRVEKRSNRRHINLINAMAKVQKKRESALQKQQAQANIIAMRKANENAQAQPQARTPVMRKTPRDYSLMRWERDQALAEKMAQYAQRHEAQRRQQALQARQAQASMAAATAAAAAAGQVPPNAAHLGQSNQLAAAAAAAAAAGRANLPSQFGMPSQAARPGMPMPSPVNGMAGLPNHLQSGLMRQMPMNGMSPQLQAMQAQHRLPMAAGQQDAHVILAARRISEQQRQAVQMQHSQQPPQSQSGQQHSPPPPQPPHTGPGTPVPQGSPPQSRNGINGINAQSFMSNAQSVLAASFNQGHGAPQLGTPTGGAMHLGAGLAGSPRPHGAPMQLPAALANQIQALESQCRQKNPNATPEQARQYAMEHLNRILSHRQAMNAAAGAGSPPTMANGLPGGASPAQYAALLRQQQQQHQAQQLAAAQAAQAGHGGVSHHQRNSSGSATPGK